MTSDISYQNENVPLLKANATKMTGVSSSPIASLKKKLAFGFAVGIGLMYAATSGSGYIRGPYLSLLRGGVEVQVTGGCGLYCSTCVGFWKQNNYCDGNDGPLSLKNQVCGCLNNNNFATTAECEVSYPNGGGQCPLGSRYAFYNGEHDDEDEEDACGGYKPRNRPACQYADGCTPGCEQCSSNLECSGGAYGFIDSGICCSPGLTMCDSTQGAESNYNWLLQAPSCFPPQEPVVTAPAPAPSPVGIKAYWKEIPSTAITRTQKTAYSNKISSSTLNAIENGYTASVTLGYGPLSATGGLSHDNTNTKTYSVTYGGSSSGTITKTTKACPTGDKEYTWVIEFSGGDKQRTDVVCISDEVSNCFRYAQPQCPAGFCGCVSCECCSTDILNTVPNFPVAKICKDDSLATYPGGLATCDWDSVAQASSIQEAKELNEMK